MEGFIIFMTIISIFNNSNGLLTEENLHPSFYSKKEDIKKYLIEIEILDRRESILKDNEKKYSSFLQDMMLLCKRYNKLKDAPMISESERFPSNSEIRVLIAHNRAYNNYLENRIILELDRKEFIGLCIRENNNIYHILDKAFDATCQYYYINFRREALKELKQILTSEQYQNGILPPSVPLWRFNEVDR